MKSIAIYKNPYGDTRTAPKDVEFWQFQRANDDHIDDVKAVMENLAEMIDVAGHYHDCTKKSQELMFWRDFCDTLETGKDFTKSEWHQLHVKAERHHLLSNCPDDVNLIDVLEMIADCTCAGLTRSGEVRDLEISPEILEKAAQNTVKLIKSMITVFE